MNIHRTLGRKAGLALLGSLVLVGSVAGIAGADSGVEAQRRGRPQITAEQRSCLKEQGLTRPEAGTKPSKDQRAKIKAAAKECGVKLPKHGRFGRNHRVNLTDEQKSCLKEQGVTRPERGTPPSAELREKMKAAAEACDIEVPGKPSNT